MSRQEDLEEPPVTKSEVPEWRKPPPGDKLVSYFASAGTAAGGIAFVKPYINLAPSLALPLMLLSVLMFSIRPGIFKGHKERLVYDTAYQFMFLLSVALIIVWIGDNIVPANKQLGGVATLVPGLAAVQANVLPVSPTVKAALTLDSKLSDSDPAARLQAVTEALNSPDANQHAAGESIIRNSADPNLRLLGLETALREKAGAYIEVSPTNDAPDNALTQALHGASIYVGAVSARGDNFLGHLGPYDAHGSLESPARFSIGSAIDVAGVGTKVPVGIVSDMSSDGSLIGVAHAGSLMTPVNVSLPRI